ncbi:MAG: FIST C-terminal domain-containing protein [Synergistaceae bacterium]|nr:FIST C-terminal domain-containing protein [Synergistaceae bacterium]
MRSIIAVTYEMDDAEKAVRDLLKQVEDKGPLGKSSCGLVYCDVEMDHEAFAAALKENFPFEVTGCTSIANFVTEQGAQILSAVLVILTADDAKFSIAVTDTLTAENLRRELETAYTKTVSDVGERGRLLFLVPPFNDAIPLDEYVDTLSDISGDIPIFGGLPSSNIADGDILMYAGGRPYTDRAAIILVGGNVQPLFSVQNVLSAFSEQKRTVTKARDNIVYTVEDMTFMDSLKSFGLAVDDLVEQGDLAVYVSTPLKVYLNKNNYNDGIPVVRTIKKLNPEDGSGVLFGSISDQSTISIATMKRQDIQDSCKLAIKEILAKIDESRADYTYTTLICVSCGGRYMVMADDKEVEGDIILENLPKSLTLSGFYAYGEICPTAIHDGKAVNRVHNESIVMCAL